MIFGHSLGHELLRTRSKDPCLSASAAHSCQGHRLCGWERSDYGSGVRDTAELASLAVMGALRAPAARTPPCRSAQGGTEPARRLR
jgi:hypothetical protein